MGKRGPQPTPTKVLAARGSWLAKTREGEPEADGAPKPPDWLAGESLEAWRSLLPMLEGMGVVGSVDAYALARYCRIYQRWRECERFIDENGMVNERGNEYPQVGRASKLADQLLKLEQHFGMTASARASLAVDTSKQSDGKHGNSGSPLKPRLVG